MGNLRGVFSQENTPEGYTETHKCSFFPYKQVSGRNGDHEWLRVTNAFILCDLVWKVQKSHAVNREGSFNWVNILVGKLAQGHICDSNKTLCLNSCLLDPLLVYFVASCLCITIMLYSGLNKTFSDFWFWFLISNTANISLVGNHDSEPYCIRINYFL